MSHENSETIQRGRYWQNIYGQGTPRQGMPLPREYAFEKTLYPDLQEAEGAAIVRSLLANREENHSPYQRLFDVGLRGHDHVKK